MCHTGVFRGVAGTDTRFGVDRGRDAPHLPNPSGPVRLDESPPAPVASHLRDRVGDGRHRLVGVAGADGPRLPGNDGRVRALVVGHAGCRVRQGEGGGPMSATAVATLETNGAPDVLVGYARFVAGLK